MHKISKQHNVIIGGQQIEFARIQALNKMCVSVCVVWCDVHVVRCKMKRLFGDAQQYYVY